MTARLSKTQLAALEKLADGQRRSLASFATNTIESLLARRLIEVRWNNRPGIVDAIDYRITDAGRVALPDNSEERRRHNG
jgi:hypothetical protein